MRTLWNMTRIRRERLLNISGRHSSTFAKGRKKMLTHPITVYSHVHVHTHSHARGPSCYCNHCKCHHIYLRSAASSSRLLRLHCLLFNSSPLGDVGLDHLKLLAGLQIPVCLLIHLAPECTWERGREERWRETSQHAKCFLAEHKYRNVTRGL